MGRNDQNRPRTPSGAPNPIGDGLRSAVNWWGGNVRGAVDAYNRARGDLFYGLTGGLIDTRPAPRRPSAQPPRSTSFGSERNWNVPMSQVPRAPQPPRTPQTSTQSQPQRQAPSRQQLVSQSSVPVRTSTPRGRTTSNQTAQTAGNPAISGYIPDSNYRPLWQMTNEQLMQAAPQYITQATPSQLVSRAAQRPIAQFNNGSWGAVDQKVEGATTVDPAQVDAFQSSGNYFEDLGRVTGDNYQVTSSPDGNSLNFQRPTATPEPILDPMLRFRRNQMERGIIGSGADYYITTGSDGRTTRRLSPEELSAFKLQGRLPSDYVAAAYQRGGGNGGFASLPDQVPARKDIDFTQAEAANYQFPRNPGLVAGVDYSQEYTFGRPPVDTQLAFSRPRPAVDSVANVIGSENTTADPEKAAGGTFNFAGLLEKAGRRANLNFTRPGGTDTVLLPYRGGPAPVEVLPDRGRPVEVTTLPFKFR